MASGGFTAAIAGTRAKNTSPYWTRRGRARGVRKSGSSQNTSENYSMTSAEPLPMSYGRRATRSRTAWRSPTRLRRCSSAMPISSLKRKSRHVNARCSSADGSGENHNWRSRWRRRQRCNKSKRTVRGQSEQKRREPIFRLPFNSFAFYEFVGCGGLQPSEFVSSTFQFRTDSPFCLGRPVF